MRAVCGWAVALLLLAACGSGDAGPVVGQVAYTADGCELVYTGAGPYDVSGSPAELTGSGGWDRLRIGAAAYCYEQVGTTRYDAYEWPERLLPGRWRVGAPVFERDFDDGRGGYQFHTLVARFRGQDVWVRMPLHGEPFVEVLDGGTWLPLREYEARVEAARRAQEERERAQAEHNREQIGILLHNWRAGMAEAARPWARPTCYERCWP